MTKRSAQNSYERIVKNYDKIIRIHREYGRMRRRETSFSFRAPAYPCEKPGTENSVPGFG